METLHFTLKDVITLGVILATTLGSWYSLRERVIRIETKLEPLWNNFTHKSRSAKAGD